MRRRTILGGAVAGAGLLAGLPAEAGTGPAVGRPHADGVRRTTLYTRSDPGIRIHVRELVTLPRPGLPPVLLVHGARPDGMAAFDLPVEGGSLAADLARIGFPTYVMDVRGFGASTYPAPMTVEPVQDSPIVRSDEAVRDVAAAIALVRRRTGVERVAGFGWATGAHWLGMYAALEPAALSDLVMLNTLYSGTSAWPVRRELADPENPEQPRPQPSWRAVTADSLTARWDEQIPTDNPDDWRDPAVRAAYRREAIAADPTSGTRNPPSFRSPTGTLVDAFYLAQGRQFYDASLIRARTLVVRGEADFWSRPEDAERLAAHLTSAAAVRSVTIPDALHYLHLDRPERGRARLLTEVGSFLATR